MPLKNLTSLNPRPSFRPVDFFYVRRTDFIFIFGRGDAVMGVMAVAGRCVEGPIIEQ